MPITKERFADVIEAAASIRDRHLATVEAFHQLAANAQSATAPGSREYQLITQIITYCQDPRAYIARECEIIAAEEALMRVTFARNEYSKRYALKKRQEKSTYKPQQPPLIDQRRNQLKQNQMDLAYSVMNKSQDLTAEIGKNTAMAMTGGDIKHLKREEVPPNRLAEWDAEEAKAKAIMDRINAQREQAESNPFDTPEFKLQHGIAMSHIPGGHKSQIQGKTLLCECGDMFFSLEEWTQHVHDNGAWSNEQITRPINVPESVRFPEDDPTFALLGGIIPKSDSPTEDKS